MDKHYNLVHETAKERAIAMIQSLPVQQKDTWRIIMTQKEEDRTLAQNRKLHKIYGELASQTGYSTEEMKHEVMMILGYTRDVRRLDGSIDTVREETHKMSIKRLSQLIEETYIWAEEQGFIL